MLSKTLKLFVLSFLMISLVAAGGIGEEVKAQDNVRSIIVGSGGAGGSWYLLGAQMGELIQEDMGIPVTVVEGGAISNVRLTNEGRDMDMGITSLPNLLDAIHGKGVFKEDNIDNVAPIVNFATDYVQFTVLGDSDIKEFADLKDKRILPGPKGWGIEALTKEVLGLYDLSYEKIKDNGGGVSYVSWGEAPSLLKDGHADMAAFKGVYPNAHIMEIEATNEARVLSLDEEKIEEFIEGKQGYFKGTVPAGTYKGQEEDALTIGHTSVLFAEKKLPEDVVYNILKLLMENKEQLNEISGVELGTNPLKGIDPSILHPGAKKYYEEKGML